MSSVKLKINSHYLSPFIHLVFQGFLEIMVYQALTEVHTKSTLGILYIYIIYIQAKKKVISHIHAFSHHTSQKQMMSMMSKEL